jgi:histidine triad (HIT) family protein
MPAYDPNNPFAKILRGEFPCYKVYEDEHTLAFLDIMPRCPGHTLVIPKAPARNILDISPEDLAYVARTSHKIARAAMTAFKADGITVQQFNEHAGGQVVYHRAAIQRTCRRTGGFSPAHACDAAPRRRGAAAARQPQGRWQGA